MTPRRIPILAAAVLLALALAGCGEIKNTLTPKPGTANQILVALPTAFNANYIGIYDAAALGYFNRADLDVTFESAAPGSDPSTVLNELWSHQAFVAVSSEPTVLWDRNEAKAVVSVAALFQGALTITQAVAPSGGKSASPKATKAPTTYQTVPDTSLLPTELQTRTDLPTYQGLVLVARKATIVSDTSPLRRFVQAVARGYRAVARDPSTAIANVISYDPALAKQKALITAGVTAALPSFFPPSTAKKHYFGYQYETDWNAFGTWLHRQNLLSNPNAIPAASTNELLAGQGI